MAKLNLKDAPYMVASYVRCEDVRHLRTKINIERCYYLLKDYVSRDNKEVSEKELRKEVGKILELENRVYELERKTFLSNRDMLNKNLNGRELGIIVLEFQKHTPTIEELENYLKRAAM